MILNSDRRATWSLLSLLLLDTLFVDVLQVTNELLPGEILIHFKLGSWLAILNLKIVFRGILLLLWGQLLHHILVVLIYIDILLQGSFVLSLPLLEYLLFSLEFSSLSSFMAVLEAQTTQLLLCLFFFGLDLMTRVYDRCSHRHKTRCGKGCNWCH